jgi:hypothetical protein
MTCSQHDCTIQLAQYVQPCFILPNGAQLACFPILDGLNNLSTGELQIVSFGISKLLSCFFDSILNCDKKRFQLVTRWAGKVVLMVASTAKLVILGIT